MSVLSSLKGDFPGGDGEKLGGHPISQPPVL